MESEISEEVEVRTESFFLEEHSSPKRIIMCIPKSAPGIGKLHSSTPHPHWVITDSKGEVSKVRVDVVVGELPVLALGEEFEYFRRSHFK